MSSALLRLERHLRSLPALHYSRYGGPRIRSADGPLDLDERNVAIEAVLAQSHALAREVGIPLDSEGDIDIVRMFGRPARASGGVAAPGSIEIVGVGGAIVGHLCALRPSDPDDGQADGPLTGLLHSPRPEGAVDGPRGGAEKRARTGGEAAAACGEAYRAGTGDDLLFDMVSLGKCDTIRLRLRRMCDLAEGEERECPIASCPFDEAATDFSDGGGHSLLPPPHEDRCIAVMPCGHSFSALHILYHAVVSGMRCPVCRAGVEKGMRPSCIPLHIRRLVWERAKRAMEAEERARLDRDADAVRSVLFSSYGAAGGGDGEETEDDDGEDDWEQPPSEGGNALAAPPPWDDVERIREDTMRGRDVGVGAVVELFACPGLVKIQP